MKKLSRLVLLIGCALLSGCVGARVVKHLAGGGDSKKPAESRSVEGGSLSHTISVNGLSRSYLLYAPRSLAKERAPLVIVLHGGGGGGEQIMEMAGWNEEAERRGWLVAYPNGSGRFGNKLLTWNAGGCCGYAQDNNIDDVTFIRKLIQDVGTRYPLNEQRVYVTGISNGAMLTYRIACEMSGSIAAIAPISGTQEVSNCRPRYPVSVMHFHGTADQNVPFDGGYGDRAKIKIEKRSVMSTLDEWRQHDRCGNKESVSVQGDTTFTKVACDAGNEVILAKIEGGGHAWPGAKVATRSGQVSSRNIDATREMAVFFERHSR